MIKWADYIAKIEISSLWSGHKHIVWELRPGVNVLSGRNGAGKTTILNKLIQHLRSLPATGELIGNSRLGVRIDFSPSDATGIRYDSSSAATGSTHWRTEGSIPSSTGSSTSCSGVIWTIRSMWPTA